MIDLTELWIGILTDIRPQVSPQIYDNWFEAALIPCMYENDVLTLDTTSRFVCSFISKKYTNLLETAASHVTGRPTQVRLIYSTGGETTPGPSVSPAAPSSAPSTPAAYHPEKTVSAAPASSFKVLEEDTIRENQEYDEPEWAQTTLEPVDTENPDTYEYESISLPEIRSAKDITPPPAAEKPEPVPAAQVPVSDGLNSNYTFDTFIVGNSNRMANAVALSVAGAPAQKYNPFFIYGDSGLGKTHLMHAIGHKIRENFPNMSLRCITSEDFANELIQSIQDKNPESFRQRYRNVDVLLVDDIQFLENKEHTQEEFFHTFNKLYQDHKQMVFTSDRPPQNLKKLENRLRSRFQASAVARITPPDLEMRTAILRRRSQSEHIEFQNDAINFIAANVSENIRELEGAFVRVTLQAAEEHSPVTLDIAQRALQDLVQASDKKKYITIDEITKAVCQFYKVKYEDLMSKKKTKSIAFPRQIAMYLCRELTENTYPHIGTAFNGRDHSTVMHACDKVAKAMEKDKNFRTMIEQLKTRIMSVDK